MNEFPYCLLPDGKAIALQLVSALFILVGCVWALPPISNVTVSPLVPSQTSVRYLYAEDNSVCIYNVNKPTSDKPAVKSNEFHIKIHPVEKDDGILVRTWWSWPKQNQGLDPCLSKNQGANTQACQNDSCLLFASSDSGEGAKEHVCRKCAMPSLNTKMNSNAFVSTGSLIVTLSYNQSLCSSVTSFMFTSYKNFDKNVNSDEYFCCDDNRCIWKGLMCDTYYNCLDGSDEKLCDGSGGTTTMASLPPAGFNDVTLTLIICMSVVALIALAYFMLTFLFSNRGPADELMINSKLQ